MEHTTAVTALAALAHDTRLAAFRLLVECGPDGVQAGQVAAALSLPGATLSFHLKELKAAGLVTCERRGRSLIYRADCDCMEDLVGFLTRNCCQGSPATLSDGGNHETAACTQRR